MRRCLLPVLLVGAGLPAIAAHAPSAAALDREFQQTVRPFVARYCAGCHSGKTAPGQLDLKSFDTFESVTHDFPRWELAATRLGAHEMPPKGMTQPPDEARQRVIAWIHGVREEEIRKSAGDPGNVLPRRLSNAEYDYTIRDLTGADIQPAREFPVDPANQAGFDNSGESLTMSPALLNKYLAAARAVANDMALTPDG